MPKDTKTLGNNKTQACESLGFAHKKRGYVCFDTPSSALFRPEGYAKAYSQSLFSILRCFWTGI
jgi:hypothetical protein